MSVAVSPELLERLNRPGPRYTSYPTAPTWTGDFGPAAYRRALQDLARANEDELSLYLHLPFCLKRCHYCGCNSCVAADDGDKDAYLDRLASEIAQVSGILGQNRRVAQIHWGGGTPNFFNDNQLRRIVEMIGEAFIIAPAAEISLEADPRLGTPAQAELLRELGFNRISLGVQDFQRQVQVAIGRVQPEALTRRFFAACRQVGFGSVNLDLVYGLPGQTRESFGETLDIVLDLGPERIACFGYAHVPWVKSNQEKIDTSLLPDPQQKFALFQQAVDTFTAAGYEWIGLDHFARSDDELSIALRERRLHRNFMGYTTRPAGHLVAFGMSGISEVAGCFAQNNADLAGYQNAIAAGQLPIVRGLALSEDDALRRQAILNLMCNLELPFALTVERFGVTVPEALGPELARLRAYEREGLLRSESDRLIVTELGRYFVRNLCMELDAYLDRQSDQPLFSRTV